MAQYRKSSMDQKLKANEENVKRLNENRNQILRLKHRIIEKRTLKQQENLYLMKKAIIERQERKENREALRQNKVGEMREYLDRKQQAIAEDKERTHYEKIQKLQDERSKAEEKKEHSLQILAENMVRKDELRQQFLREKRETAQKTGNLKEYFEYRRAVKGEEAEGEYDDEEFEDTALGSNSAGVQPRFMTRANSAGDLAAREQDRAKRLEYQAWIQEKEYLDQERRSALRELKARDAQRKVEKARTLEAQKMREIERKIQEKAEKSEAAKLKLLQEKAEKTRITRVKTEKARAAAQKQEYAKQQKLRELERRKEFKEYIVENILLDKTITQQERARANNENRQRKYEYIKAVQEVEFHNKIEKIVNKMETKEGKVDYISKTALSKSNENYFKSKVAIHNQHNENEVKRKYLGATGSSNTWSKSMTGIPTRSDLGDTKIGDLGQFGYRENLKSMSNAMLQAEKDKLLRRLKM